MKMELKMIAAAVAITVCNIIMAVLFVNLAVAAYGYVQDDLEAREQKRYKEAEERAQ